MMTSLTTARSRLLLGSGIAALALSSASSASAQVRQGSGFQAVPTVVQGEVSIDRSPNQDVITVFQGPTAVINWDPRVDVNGDAAIFLPEGNVGIFQSGLDTGDFAVINRVLPAPNNNIVQINGTVIGRLQTSAGNVPGGYIVFYSPTGILVGSTAVFDIGKLLLTTLDVTGFDPQTQTINLAAGQGPAARVETLPGSQFFGGAENSLVALIGHQVIHSGTINVNGTAAFVVGEQVNLKYDQGLLDITVPVGTDIFDALVHNGTTGGPSSSGAGDNHMIYAVARAKAEPISMLLSGNLGFAPAQSAGVVNGEIILSANFDVFGRDVAGGTISDGINAEFNVRSPASTTPANLRIAEATITSSVLAVGTDSVLAEARNAPLTVDGNLLLAGSGPSKGAGNLVGAFGSTVNVAGDVLIYSRDVGEIDVEFADPSLINARGGEAGIVAAGAGSKINVTGNVRLDVSATAGQDTSNAAAGSATGGQAQISAENGGAINILGDVTIDSSANGLTEIPALTAGDIRGGQAQLLARNGGSLAIGGNLTSLASAFGVNGDTQSVSSGSAAFGGIATLAALSGDIQVGGDTLLVGRAFAGGSNQAAKGANADGGAAIIGALGQGSLAFGGDVTLDASVGGGTNIAGEGGDGFGGFAGLFSQDGGEVVIAGDLRADASASGGHGTSGGDAEAGAAIIEVAHATAALQGFVLLNARATGGSALFGFGGNGGNALGGATSVFVDASLETTSRLDIGEPLLLRADGIGGDGGAGDGASIAPGRGGTAIGGQSATANQANSRYFNGANVFVDADNGTFNAGNISARVTGFGGVGGAGGIGQKGGNGGTGIGGDVFVGLTPRGGDGSLGMGIANLGLASLIVMGRGGAGGLGGSPDGDGGAGFGGSVEVTTSGGTLTGNLSLTAEGIGGAGETGGSGFGGRALVTGSLGGEMIFTQMTLKASGIGGIGNVAGGFGVGGGAFLLLNDASLETTGGAAVLADGEGGDSLGAKGADAVGGTAQLQVVNGSADIGTALRVQAKATGGAGIGGGHASGGSSEVEVGFGTLAVGGSVLVSSEGRGGDASFGFGGRGGDGEGGRSLIEARGTLTDPARISIGGDASVLAEGYGGLGGIGDGVQIAPGAGGNGTGGRQQLDLMQVSDGFANGATLYAHGDNGSVSVGGVTLVSANGEGGQGGMAGAGQIGAIGGIGQGGSSAAGLIGGNGDGSLGAGSASFGEIIVQSNGLGGRGGLDPTGAAESGNGGDGIGGTGLLSLEFGDLQAAIARLHAFGEGGLGANGGMGIGGGVRLSGITGGSATMTQLHLAASANGGAGVDGNGGGAIAGTAVLDMDALDLTVTSRTTVRADAVGGDASGGKGGDALGGIAQIGSFTFEPGAGAFGGVTNITANATGGASDGNFGGGRAEAGEAIVMANGGTSLTIKLASLAANAFGGSARGSGTGGEAIGGTMSVTVDAGGSYDGRIAGGVSAFGGESTGGTGGNAYAGSGQILVDDASVELNGVNQVIAQAFGGAGGVMGGEAFGGSAELAILNRGAMTISPDINGVARLLLSANALGGEGPQLGDAVAGSASFDLLNGSFTANDLALEADAFSQGGEPGAIGGFAHAGGVALFVEDDSTVDLSGKLSLSASAFGAVGGSTSGGFAGLDLVGAGPQIMAGSVEITTNASDADTNEAGHFAVAANGGTLAVNDFAAVALGSTIPEEQSSPLLVADGGNIAISGEMLVDVLDKLRIRTGENGKIGGPSFEDPTAQISLISGRTVVFEGDNDNVISFGGQSLTVRAFDVDILEGARIGAVEMRFDSRDTENPALIGADPGGYNFGFTLKPRDAERIEAGTFTFNAPVISKEDPNDPDLVIGDITAFGSLDNGVSRISVDVSDPGGIIRVEGLVQYVETAETDSLRLLAGERIEVVTPGGIAVTAPGGAPGGMLVLDAPNIWAADADMISRLQSDPVFLGRNTELAVAASGSEDPLGYIRARSVEIFAGQTLLVRNTGSEAEQGGITVGDGGLFIAATGSDPLDAFAYGRRVDASGNFITGDAFFAEVIFGGETSEGSSGAGFTEESEFNDCNINTGECPLDVPEEPAGPALTNPTTTIAPVRQVRLGGSTRIGGNAASGYSQTDRIAALRLAASESDATFGMDFPGLVEAPLMSDNPLVEDPVASGGDTTLYGQGEEDEDDKDSNAGEEEGEEDVGGRDDDGQ